MSSKGYIRIPDAQLHLERRKRMKHKTWHQHIMNLLLGKNVCGSCLRIEDELIHWDAEFVMLRYDHDIESSLKNIMITTFGASVTSIIPAENFCKKCVDTILTAHLLILQLRNNCNEIQKQLTEISQQMKWTNYLNENGSLMETVNNKTTFDDDCDPETTATNNFKDIRDSIEKSFKTHKIILNNESLKTKLLQEPDMHKFLVKKVSETLAEPKLPVGITVRKVARNADMSDFVPHDLLELKWAEDENVSIGTDEVPDKKLQSNEALIMNLMEEAKTVEKHKHFHDNLKLQVNQAVPPVEQALNDSLSVKLVQNETQEVTGANENDSDNEDVVPQDLLELKWPDEQCNAIQTKIPVKKLNFNDALTVKYIPSHKHSTVEDGDNEMAPHELLELNWNEEADMQNTDLPQDNQKHNINLTQWLQDQGMSIIKTKVPTPENSNLHDLNTDIEAHISKKTKLENNSHNHKEYTLNIRNQMIALGKTRRGAHSCSVRIPTKSEENLIKCALCDLTFVQYESYSTHYKKHNIAEVAKCYRCSGKFPVIELLVEHLLLVHSEDMAYCTLCYALLYQNKVAKHMEDYHARKVEIINADITLPMLTKDGRCKKCNQVYIVSLNTPHICVFRSECPECSENCIHEKYLQSYIDQIKDNKPVFKCMDCDYLYKTKQDIIKHANYMHLKHESHQCVVCKARFSTQFELSSHNDAHHFPCDRCKKVCADKDILCNHDCPRESLKDLICGCCGQKFVSQRGYDQHTHTALAVSDDCTLCRDTVSNRCNMSRHMQVVHQVSLKKVDDKIQFECIICQKIHNSNLDFNQHVCLYECQFCAKRFTTKILLDNHLANHTHSKQVLVCSICNLQLLNKYALGQHMLKHRGYEKCPVCFNYIGKRVLAKHIQSHKDPKNSLKCPHCSLLCENQNQFEVHVNRFHLLTRPYQCDICKKSYYSKHKVREHIKQHSTEARRERCPLCPKRFARKQTLNKHMKLHTTGKLFNCDACDKMYISVALLNQHRMTHTEDDSSEFPKAETSKTSQN